MPQFISKFVICSEINKAASTGAEISASDEESDLSDHLQKQLEEDVASDAYTECNIEHQEHEIITYLNKTFNKLSPVLNKASHEKEGIPEVDVFSIPDCTLNSSTETYLSKTKGASPSTELTKEYYALVPINGSLLEKELIEQDKLSNAFLSIIKTQVDDKIETQTSPPIKPTSLSLFENTSNKTVIHSNNLSTYLSRTSNSKSEGSNEKLFPNSSQVSKFAESNNSELTYRNCEPSVEKFLDSTYSPDSLITDELSSSSDYLSATYTCSPGQSLSNYSHNFNPSDHLTKMERNNVNVTDSGIENAGQCDNVNSHVDVTLADISLSENNLRSCIPEDSVNSHQCPQTSTVENKKCQRPMFFASTSEENMTGKNKLNYCYICKPEDTTSGKTIKEEKQRQNEEIVTLESSSLSSETGSWESVYPPKYCERNRHITKHVTKKINKHFRGDKFDDLTVAGIFAAEETEEVKSDKKQYEKKDESKVRGIPIPGLPVPFSNRYKKHSSEMSDDNDNEDSLESADQMEDFDLNESPSLTIFDMLSDTPRTNEDIRETVVEPDQILGAYSTKTPTNSMLLVKDNYIPVDYENKQKPGDILPITSNRIHQGDKSKSNENRIDHSTSKRDINDKPIISGAYTEEVVHNEQKIQVVQSKPSCGSAWIVDMSIEPGTSSNHGKNSQKTNESVLENSKFVPKSNAFDDNKSKDVVESNIVEKSSQTFFVDLSSLSEQLLSNKNDETEPVNEKDNMFTMYIDIGENSSLKGKPPINLRKSSSSDPRVTIKNVSTEKEIHGIKKNVIGNKSLIVFEKLETLCNDPNININEIIKNPETLSDTLAITEIKPDVELNDNDKPKEVFVTNKNVQNLAVVREEEPVTTDLIKDTGNNNLFVKLSDLDKPLAKPTDFDNVKSKADTDVTLYEDKVWDARMTRSIPDNNWGDSRFSGNSIISSIHSENVLSLNRLFPHLINTFSRSVPASLSIETHSPMRLECTLNSNEEDKRPSDTSELSSMQSSACRSLVGNSISEEISHISNIAGSCQSRLGQDLLRMFIEEIATDVVVEVNGKRIKAHKCILSSRCQYFAGILSGGYVESAGNIITLPLFSYNVTYFVMCHIYSGISVIPDSLNILELATLTDMLGLEGLKEAIMFTLKAKYCHHFHEPCQVCIAGVLECFPLSSAYGLDDLYLKCLKWITKYYVTVWPTKAFATLPTELLEKCYHQQTIHFTPETLVNTIFGYGIIMSSLQNNRWGSLLHRMCRRLIQAAAHYASQRMVEVFKAIKLVTNNAQPHAKQALEECLAAAIEWAQPEEACRTYAFLSSTIKEMETQQQSAKSEAPNTNHRRMSGSTNLLYNYAPSWRLQCEGALVRSAPRVVATKAFQNLPFDLRKRLRELGCILFASQAMPRGSSSQYNKRITPQNRHFTRSLDIEHVRAAFMSYSTKPTLAVAPVDVPRTCVDPRDLRKPVRTLQPPKVRMTKAQEQRAKFNMTKHTQSPKTKKTNNVPVVKSKYLEPRTRKDSEKTGHVTNKAGAKMISSSESSRNSSPSQIRRYQMRNKSKYHMCEMSQDSLATLSQPRTPETSTDSRSESHNKNIYATYTKVKREVKAPVEPVQHMKCHVSSRDTELQGKTKVSHPVSGNKLTRENKTVTESTKGSAVSSNTITKSSSKCMDRTSGSLMNATKSSSAKMVPKAMKTNTRQVKVNKTPLKSPNLTDDNVIAMKRSGTFLMDEPTVIEPPVRDNTSASQH